MTLSKDQQIRDQAASVKPASNADVLLRSAVIRQLERLCEKPLAPALYLVATPIGNLGDITLRALATLFRADVVACEDTRHSQKLLAAYSLKKRTIAYHDFSTEADRARIAGLIAGGSSVALISDAGTPLVSDPGYKLVQEILARGGEVFAIPGASAVLTALAPSGMPTDRFCFQGFIPQKEQARRRFLAAALEHDIPQIFFETTRRLPKTLDLIEELAPDRPIAVARELTKLHEAFLRGNAKSILKEIQDTELPGEITMIVGAAPEKETGEQDIEAALRVALERGSLKDAVDDVSRLFKTPRRTIYNLALSVIKTRNDEL